MTKRLCLTISLGLGCLSCEEGTNLTDFPYVERMVINGVVEAGGTEVVVHFSRTLRQDETFNPARAALADVSAMIISGSGSSYPLVHDTLGLYRAIGLTLIPGERINLEAKWNGRRAAASTVVPYPPDAVSSRLSHDTTGSQLYTLHTIVRARVGEAYGQTWELRRSGELAAGGVFREVVRLVNANAWSEAQIVEEYVFSLDPLDTLLAIVHSYDDAFYDFFITRGSNVPGYDDLLFRQTGGPIKWNVTGDGIGLFVGHATTTAPVLP